MKTLTLKKERGHYRKHNELHDFLYHFQLYEVERPAVVDNAYAVGGHLARVFEEGYAP